MDMKPIDNCQTQSGNVIVVDPRRQDYKKLVSSAVEHNLRLQFFISGDEALRSATATLCDLWLVNTHLPDMSGVELMLLVRERDPQAVIFLVGNSHDHEDEISARTAGPTAYVCKPPHSVWLSGISSRSRASPTGHVPLEASSTPSTVHY